MLWWHRRLTLIDHGAALYFHHIDGNYLERSRIPFSPIKNHVLLPIASELHAVDLRAKELLNAHVIGEIVNLIPTSWLEKDPFFSDTQAHRAAYIAYLLDRLANSHIFVEEALRARDQLV
jgi:hypothetical protein